MPEHPRALDHEIAQILASLSVTSNGRIYSYQPIGSKGGFSSSPPKSGDSHPPHIFWRLEYDRQEFDAGRRSVIDRARAELDALRVRVVPEGFRERPEPPVERTGRLLKEGEGIPLQEAAFRLNCAPSELLRLRKDNKRDGQTGRLIAPVDPSERRSRAVALYREGVSTRDIQRLIGVQATQVLRWVRAENGQ